MSISDKTRNSAKNGLIFLTAAFFAFMGASLQMDLAAEELNRPNRANESEEGAMPHSGAKKILVACFSRSGNTREIAG